MGGPPSKPKYYLMIDSVLVPWGKGEKNLEKRSEIDLKPDAYKQSEQGMEAKVTILELWRRTFCIMSQRVSVSSKLKPLGVGAGKPSLNRAT